MHNKLSELTRQSVKDLLTEVIPRLDKQARSVLRNDQINVIGARLDERDHVQIQIQYLTGETLWVGRETTLPDGDVGGSMTYQVKILEALALEYAACINLLDRMESRAALLANPPEPVA